eukprot:363137-Chlamydomonas_euryale.AAC.11
MDAPGTTVRTCTSAEVATANSAASSAGCALAGAACAATAAACGLFVVVLGGAASQCCAVRCVPPPLTVRTVRCT